MSVKERPGYARLLYYREAGVRIRRGDPGLSSQEWENNVPFLVQPGAVRGS